MDENSAHYTDCGGSDIIRFMTAEFNTAELDVFFRSFLDIEGFASCDSALNGIQVDNDGSAVSRIAFAVDAAMETFEYAAAIEAGALFVHHGLFWGAPSRIAGNLRQRIKFLLDHNICLYAVHLPLDQSPRYGNNICISGLLGLDNVQPFGTYHGKKIGYKGTLRTAVSVKEAVQKINFLGRPPAGILPFGKEKCRTAAVVSGGAAENIREAIDEGIDLFVTGESTHSIYHDCLEGKINMIAGGHYSTEVWGVLAVMRHCIAELRMDAEFIDVPTGL